LFWPTLDEAGRIALWVLLPTSSPDKALYSTDPGGTPILVVEAGQPVPGAPAGTIYAGVPGAPSVLLNPSGEIAATILVLPPLGIPGSETDALLVPDGPGALQLGFMYGDDAPGAPGDEFVGFADPQIGPTGAVAFRGYLRWVGSTNGSNDTGIWISDGVGGYALIAREGLPSTVPARSYSDMRSLVVNASGDLAFGDRTGSRVGIWRITSSGVVLAHSDGDPAPGRGGMIFTDLDVRAMDAQGRLLVHVAINDPVPSGPDILGYWIESSPGVLVSVAEEGAPAPVGAPGVTYADVREPQMNAAGELLFLATLTGAGVGATNDRVVMARDLEGVVRPIVREGDVLEVAPGDFRTVSFVFVDAGEKSPFGPDQLNAAGQALILLHFDDGSQGLFLADLRNDAAAVPALPLPLLGALGLALLVSGAWIRRRPRVTSSSA
jgi:hypothetical protein